MTPAPVLDGLTMGSSATRSLLLLLLFFLLLASPSRGTLMRGSLAYKERRNYFRFLTRFGVAGGHQVHVFGNSTRVGNSVVGFSSRMAMAFLPEDAWHRFNAQSEKSQASWCYGVMQKALNDSRTTTDCSNGTQDYLRVLPCTGGECGNQPSGELLPGTMFTYNILSPRTQFYYLLLIGCTQGVNASLHKPLSCDWSYSEEIDLSYSIHLTSGDPQEIPHNPFIYEFSYEHNGALIIAIVFLILYIILTVSHFTAHIPPFNPHGCRMHRLVAIFTLSLSLKVIHVVLDTTHFAVFAHDGVGVIGLRYSGEICNLLSDWVLILVFILIGKGWQITMCSLRWKKVTFTIWAVYITFSFAYFVWVVVSDGRMGRDGGGAGGGAAELVYKGASWFGG